MTTAAGSLLPWNASPQERALEAATARVGAVPMPMRTLWNPDTCPAAQLPWLAWALSVDVWDADWTDAQKRAAVRASFAVHQRKGTVGAVLTSLASLGWATDVVEWFEDSPAAAPYTFRVEAELDARGIAPGLYEEIERLALAAKNVRSHLTRISLLSRLPCDVVVGGAVLAAEVVEVQPYQIGLLESAGVVGVALGLMTHETVTLSPPQVP